MRVTQATKMDISLVEDVLRRNHLPYKDIASKIGALFIWRTNQDIIGIGGLELYDRVGLLRSLVIEERFRGKGSGKKLCSELVGLAKRKRSTRDILTHHDRRRFLQKKWIRENRT